MSYRLLDTICVIGMVVIIVSFAYWWYYPEIHELIERLQPIDWSVL